MRGEAAAGPIHESGNGWILLFRGGSFLRDVTIGCCLFFFFLVVFRRAVDTSLTLFSRGPSAINAS